MTPLTRQQLRVVQMLAGGASYEEIRLRLAVEPSAVRNLLMRARRKVGATTNEHLMVILERGGAHPMSNTADPPAPTTPDTTRTDPEGPAMTTTSEKPVDVEATVAEYTVCAVPRTVQDWEMWALEVKRRCTGWSVRRWGKSLGRDGTWSVGPADGEDSTAWVAAHRFDEQTALRLASAHAPLVKVNGVAAAEMAAGAEPARTLLAGETTAAAEPSPSPHRCPRCLVRYPAADYICTGGWPTYPPDLPGGELHDPCLVEPVPGASTRAAR